MAIVSNNFNVDKNGNMTCSNGKFTGGEITLTGNNNQQVFKVMEPDNVSQMAYITPYSAGFVHGDSRIDFWYGDGATGETFINGGKIVCNELSQTSLEELKKNISCVSNLLNVVKESDIYTYNLKYEKNTDKKHYGFVIGDKYNTPNEVISGSGRGIDTYSMISVLWQAVKELTEKVEKLENEQKEEQ